MINASILYIMNGEEQTPTPKFPTHHGIFAKDAEIDAVKQQETPIISHGLHGACLQDQIQTVEGK